MLLCSPGVKTNRTNVGFAVLVNAFNVDLTYSLRQADLHFVYKRLQTIKSAHVYQLVKILYVRITFGFRRLHTSRIQWFANS